MFAAAPDNDNDDNPSGNSGGSQEDHKSEPQNQNSDVIFNAHLMLRPINMHFMSLTFVIELSMCYVITTLCVMIETRPYSSNFSLKLTENEYQKVSNSIKFSE